MISQNGKLLHLLSLLWIYFLCQNYISRPVLSFDPLVYIQLPWYISSWTFYQAFQIQYRQSEMPHPFAHTSFFLQDKFLVFVSDTLSNA